MSDPTLSPRDPSAVHLRRVLLPLAVAVVGVLASVTIWRALVTERRNQFVALVRAAAADDRTAIHDRSEAMLRALRELALIWARTGRTPGSDWRLDARMILDQYPGLLRIDWVEPSGRLLSAEAASGSSAALEVEAEERARLAPVVAQALAAREPTMVGPLSASDAPELGEGLGYRVFVPLVRRGETQGVLVATGRLDRLFEQALHGGSTVLSTLVWWDGVQVHTQGVASEESFPWWPGEEAPLALSLGPVWRVAHRPTPELHEAVLTPLPNYVLFGGLLSSLLLAALLFESGLTRAHARSLEGSHRDLDAQVRETREAERALRELARELESRVEARTADLNEAIGELESFNYSVSHDLRSPLGAILNFAAILEEDHHEDIGAAGVGLLQRIRASAESGMAMMDGLLELSRMGREELRTRRVDTQRLVAETLQEVQAGVGDREVRLELGELPAVDADPAMLRVVLVNLLRNAFKYTGRTEKPRIAVAGWRADREVVFSVRDNGVGFDPRFVGKLFRPFERLHSTDEFEGSGIGLAVVGRIVRRHGGRVWAEGEVDHGAAFFFALPERPENGGDAHG